jgi:hypothetical protein
MSFQPNDLSVLAYANNFTLWHYTTADNAVDGVGYYDGAVDMLRANDLIITNVDTDGSPSTVFYIVTGNDGNTVTVAAYS